MSYVDLRFTRWHLICIQAQFLSELAATNTKLQRRSEGAWLELAQNPGVSTHFLAMTFGFPTESLRCVQPIAVLGDSDWQNTCDWKVLCTAKLLWLVMDLANGSHGGFVPSNKHVAGFAAWFSRFFVFHDLMMDFDKFGLSFNTRSVNTHQWVHEERQYGTPRGSQMAKLKILSKRRMDSQD